MKMINPALILLFMAVWACQKPLNSGSVPATPNESVGAAQKAQTSAQATAQEQSQKQATSEPLIIQPPPAMTAMEAIRDLDKKVDQYKTGGVLTEVDIEFNRDLKRQILRGTFDIAELGKLALDVHWGEITEVQQTEFIDLLQSLLEKKAIFSKEQTKTQGKSYQIIYDRESYLDEEKKQSKVETRILIPKDDVDLKLDYKLVLKGGIWKIFDVIVDGASLVENYKYQFHTIITKNSFQDLIDRMKKKLSELESKV